MFSSTAYDAFYTYIGLHLHSAFIEILTSQRFFATLILLIFGICFFMTLVRFFSAYLPPLFANSQGVVCGRRDREKWVGKLHYATLFGVKNPVCIAFTLLVT